MAGPDGLDALDVRRLEACLAEGGVAVLPTDTVYGLACDAHSAKAVGRLYEAKGRPPRKPSAVMFFSLEAALAALGDLGERERAALCALLPGALTVLLPNRQALFPLAGGGAHRAAEAVGDAAATAALGLRVPALEGPLRALGELAGPLLQSSANVSGGAEARQVSEIPPAVRDAVDLVLDVGGLPGVASTILDLRSYEGRGSWEILRQGPVSAAQIEDALG
ncbi:MAG: L-threonylcarbamoyladenylate synthase [Solirubrobacteraceae bacterium]